MSGKPFTNSCLLALLPALDLSGIFAQQRKFIESVPAKSFMYWQRLKYNPIINGIHRLTGLMMEPIIIWIFKKLIGAQPI